MPAMIAAAALLAVSTADAQPAKTDAKPVCQELGPRHAASPDLTRPRKLNEEPPAQPILTVLRSVDGCSMPVPARAAGRR